jgi:hypothetical protein
VPALTGAMVELCHEQPEDPVRRYGFNGLFFFFFSEL